MTKMDKINAKIDKVQEKITLVGEKYDNKYTRKAVVIFSCIAFVVGIVIGFLAKAKVF
jgi:hypothetical protein